ncbi:hypothetical protein B296_00029423 [Ensete ventricosum]|uniref:Uncharacterized protein n=1 Tax=Ensete ventricosum TaxID=4639 RepID=A0A426ZZK2_ENSVE|nr:hypothetical protein B296_00029423 [Ensete ventricosum]
MNIVFSRVLNFDVYPPIRAVRTGPRGYWFADHALSSGASVLIGTEVYHPVLLRISTVIEAYWSVRPAGMVGGGIFRVLGALALAPCVDRGLSWFTVKFKFESKGQAFAAIAGLCFGLALLLFFGLTLLWA